VSNRVGTGQFLAWDGGCLFIGRHESAVPVHSHQAMQLVVGRNASPLIRAGDGAPWSEFSAALIPSRQRHGIDVTSADYGAVLFVEPETKEGRAVAERYLRNGIAEVGGAAVRLAADHLFETWLGQKDKATITASARSLVRTLSEGVEPSVVTDERIVRAVSFIGANLASALTLDQVASRVFLSPSRFRHLFAEQTGMALRPYILWRRFLHIWDLLMRGETLSTAAHAAGFADAAHLTRTSKRMFGFAPSAMQLVASPPRAAGAANDAPVNSRIAPPRAGSRTSTAPRRTASS
jgi:AraC family transcriptional regulator